MRRDKTLISGSFTQDFRFRSITKLKQVSTLFLTTIVKSKSKLPYGMLYMAKVLYNSLRRKFPETPEKDVLKVQR